MAARTAKAASVSGRKAKTWKDIDQSVKPKSMSSASEKRIWMVRMKFFGAALALGAVLIAALQLSTVVERGPELLTKAGESMPLREVDIETDGSLDQRWLLRQMELGDAENLLSIDLRAVKERLEALGQVAHAEVERQFPDALRVTITERKPVFRIYAQRSNGQQLLLFADASGYVFESDQVDPSLARYLPFLQGVSLKMESGRFLPIEGLTAAARLAEETRSIAQHLYGAWRVVSLEKAPLILVKDRTGKEILFDPDKDFRKQLARLDYIIDYYGGDLSSQISQVDLTLGPQVPVKSSPARR